MDAAAEKKELRILILEDTPTDAELEERELRKAGIAYTARRVETREAFVKALKEFHPDIVLSDYKLPDFGGMEALQIMQRDFPDVPVIIVTGALPDVEAIDLIHAGAKDYVLKDRLARLGTAVQRSLAAETDRRARAHAEQALRDSEARYRRITEGITDYQYTVLVENGRAVKTLHSPACVTVTGYKADEFTANPYLWIQMIVPEDRERVMEQVARILAGKDVPPIEHRIIRKEGKVRWVSDTAILFRDASGRLLSYDGVIKDITERKLAEKALQQSEAELRALVEHSPVAMLVNVGVETDEKIMLMNRKFTELFGYTIEDVPDVRHWWPLAYPDEKYREEIRSEWIKRVERAFQNHGDIEPMETMVACKDGSIRHIRVSLASIGNKNIITFEDFTERKRAAELIQKNNQLLETVFSSIHVLIAYLDKEFNFIKVNKVYAAADQRTPDFYPGKNHFEIFPNEENQAIFRKVAETGEPAIYFAKPFEYAEHPERGVSYWDWRLEPVKGVDGKVEGLLLSLLNVTEQTLAMQKVRAASQYARSLIEASLDPLVTISAEGIITDVNAATEKATGRSRIELTGTDFSDYFTEPDKAREGYQQVFQQGFVTDYPLAIRHRDGHVIDVLYNASVYRDESGEVQGAFAAARDITARKQAEIALQRLNRTLRTLSAGNHALVHGENEKALLEGMCHATTESGYLLAWVGYAMQDEKKSVVPMAASGKGVSYVEGVNITWADEPRGRGPTGTSIRSGQTQICHDIGNDPRMAPWRETAAKYGYASSIALPLRLGGATIGTLTIYAAETNAFDAGQVQLLEEMAGDLAFGIANLRTRNERDQAVRERQHYAERLRTSLEDALQAIAATVEMRDPYTAGHQRRVAHLASAIAHEMGLTEEQCHGVHLAGIVHDLGKIHIPAEVLSKPGRLTEIEFSFIKIHPQAGYDILKGIEFPWPIAQAVLQHHERFDGSGYPQGLQGDAISLDARILVVADVVEAMASHRPYRPALGLDAALSEISAKRGIQFDPAVADACLRLFAKRNYVLPT